MNRPSSSRLAAALALLLLGATGATAQGPAGMPADLAGDPEAEGFADLFFAQGLAALAQKDFATALARFEKAAATLPEDATYAYFAALCRSRLGRYEEAVAGLEATLPPAANRVPAARVRYDIGEARYMMGDYPGAEAAFRKSLLESGDDAWARFWLGLTLFATDRPDDAIAEFERAVEIEPALSGDGSYYMGVLSYTQGDPTTARRYFEQLGKAAPLSEELAASGRDWLHALERPSSAPETPPWEARVGLSLEHDDNPAQINDAFTPISAGSDVRAVVQGRVGANFLRGRGGWTAGAVGNLYLSRYDDLDVLDLTGLQTVLQAAWGADPLGYVNGPLGYARTATGESRFGVAVQAGASFFDLDGDSLRRDVEGGLALMLREPDFGKTQLDLRYADVTFFAPDPGDPFAPDFRILSGHSAGARISQYFFLAAPDRWVRVGLERLETATRFDPFDYDMTRLESELSLPLGGRWTLFAYAAASKDEYDESSRTFYFISEPREDTRKDASVAAVLSVWRHVYATFRVAWTDRDVEPDDLFLAAIQSYDRTTVSAGLTWYW